MRQLIVVLSLLLAGGAAAAPAPKKAAPAEASAKTAPSPSAAAALAKLSNADCLGCHADDSTGRKVDDRLFSASVHGQNSISCTDCHDGYGEGSSGHESQHPKLSAADQAVVDRLGKATWGEGEHAVKVAAPAAYLACANCHAPEAEAFFGKSIHARWLREDTGAPGPVCGTCHGSPHALAKTMEPYAPSGTARVAVPADRRAMQKTCEACHGNEEFAKAAGLNAEVKHTYQDSIHGRMVRVGNAVAPACVSCHASDKANGGTHGIVAKTDPTSPVAGANRKNTCARCHQGATDNFARLIAHKAIQETGGHVVPHVIHVAFSYLTTLTLLFFAFHVFIDFIYELRQRLAAKGHGVSADDLKSLVRFDIHQRAQHWFMLSGVILLGLTGWPLRGAGVFTGAPIIGAMDASAYSAAFMKLFGGAAGAAIWHRVGAVLIIISSVYHLFYLTFLAANKRLPISMLPMPKDALDMRDNILFMLGLKKERPQFDRYMYLEKFDYWAVFWGIVMMVGTGFVFWFPVFFAKYAPSWVITAAQIIHGEEATLAITFLFVVHFYNVHLKPSIFPMNWAWLNGRITVANLKHEHPAEYERLKDRLK
jgi:cytochrome b subunit of formate dehydrogenase/nitrate/TMAO reductase-like tetraheme cytochrome c subunit